MSLNYSWCLRLRDLKIYIFAGFAFQTLNLTNPHTFRDLSKPMGAQTVERKRKFIQRYNEVEKSEGECFRRLTDSRGLSPLRPLGILVNPLGNDTQKLFRAVAKGSTMPRRSSRFWIQTGWGFKEKLLPQALPYVPCTAAFCSLPLGRKRCYSKKAMFPRKDCAVS